MRTSRRSDGTTEIVAGFGAFGCACLVQLALLAVAVAVIVLAARWALSTHVFGL